MYVCLFYKRNGCALLHVRCCVFFQALPGPLFNLSAYLGAVYRGVPGAFIGWLGLFGPGVSLIFGFLPFWGTVRNVAWFKVCRSTRIG